MHARALRERPARAGPRDPPPRRPPSAPPRPPPPLLALLVQAAEVDPHLHVARVELEGAAVGRKGAALVAYLEGDVALELVEIGAVGRARLRLPQGGEGAGGIPCRGAAPRRDDQGLDVVRGERQQLLRERRRLGGAPQGEQRLHLAEPCGGAVPGEPPP